MQNSKPNSMALNKFFMKLLLVVVAGVMVALSGCNPARNLAVTDSLEKFEGKKFLKAAKSRDIDFETIAFNGKGKAEGMANIGFRYRINVRQGDQIWASLRVMGLEGFRARITPNRVQILDRLKAKVIEGSLEDLENRLGFTVKYNILEAILLGQAKELARMAKPTTVSAGRRHYQFTWKGTQINHAFNSQTGKLEELRLTQDVNNSRTLIEYGDHQIVDGQYVPYFVSAKSDGTKKPLDLRLQHKSVEINPSRIRFKFEVPDRYAHEDL